MLLSDVKTTRMKRVDDVMACRAEYVPDSSARSCCCEHELLVH
jgi:hypothetical protein